MSIAPCTSALAAQLDLLRLGGYGTIEYEVDGAHDLIHARTIATARPETPHERADLPTFLARILAQHDVRPGDMLALRYEGGTHLLAVITRDVR